MRHTGVADGRPHPRATFSTRPMVWIHRQSVLSLCACNNKSALTPSQALILVRALAVSNCSAYQSSRHPLQARQPPRRTFTTYQFPASCALRQYTFAAIVNSTSLKARPLPHHLLPEQATPRFPQLHLHFGCPSRCSYRRWMSCRVDTLH